MAKRPIHGQCRPTPDTATDSSSHSDRGDAQPRILPAEDLFQGQREVWIQLGDQRYRLRITAAGKLILTK
jgi:hemin uptake protein HemP